MFTLDKYTCTYFLNTAFSLIIMFFMWRLGLTRLFRTKCCSTFSKLRRNASFSESSDHKNLKNQFIDEQNSLKKKCILHDVEEWQNQLKALKQSTEEFSSLNGNLPYIIGSDISFIKGNEEDACMAVVVMKLPKLQVVYEDISMVRLTVPYIPGFLAFREAEHTVEKVKKLRDLHPEFSPLVIMLDGNGTLHDSEFGLACHVGVLLDTVTVGIAKNLYSTASLDHDDFNRKMSSLEKEGDSFPILTKHGKILGVAYRSTRSSTKPVYVSPGHKISLETAIDLVRVCCRYRVPEPIRQADIRSRQFIRDLQS